MNNTTPQNVRILAIAPTARGFGYAVFEGLDTFIDWGGRWAQGNKNKESLEKAETLIAYHRPKVLVLEDASDKGVRRDARIRELNAQIAALAKRHKVRVKIFTRNEIKKMFFADGKGTKQNIAEIVASRFSDNVGLELPPKRKTGHNEDPRMDVFAALALVLAYRLWRAKRTAYQNINRKLYLRV